MSEQSTVLREKKYGPRYTLHDPPRCFCHCVKGHNNSLRTAVEKNPPVYQVFIFSGQPSWASPK